MDSAFLLIDRNFPQKHVRYILTAKKEKQIAFHMKKKRNTDIMML
jgi:hypothetical protein